MTGYADENRPAFREAAKGLREQGYVVVSPDELDRVQPIAPKNPRKPPAWEDYMARDLQWVCAVEMVVLLPGWEASRGACLEFIVAENLGIKLMRWIDGEVVPLASRSVA